MPQATKKTFYSILSRDGYVKGTGMKSACSSWNVTVKYKTFQKPLSALEYSFVNTKKTVGILLLKYKSQLKKITVKK